MGNETLGVWVILEIWTKCRLILLSHGKLEIIPQMALPEQDLPFESKKNPAGHSHRYDPAVLTHW